MMNPQAISIVIVLLISGAVAAVMTVYALRRKSTAGMLAFAVMTAGLTWWAISYAAEMIIPGLPLKVWMTRIEYIGIVWVPFGWALFALAYTGHDKWVTRKWATLLAIIPIITIISAFTNDFHHLFYTSTVLNENGPLSIVDASYGTVWYLNFAYAYLMMFTGTVLLLIGVFSIPRAYWFQQALLVISPLVPWISNALYVLRLSPIPQLDLSPIAFTLSALILAADMFRFRLFDITPVARSAVVDHMNVAMLVVDNKNRVVDINPAACELIKCEASQALGQPVQNVLQHWPSFVERFFNVHETNEEITIPTRQLVYHYHIQINLIFNRKRHVTGRLVLLTDITKDKLAEKALAMTQVRTEFLAKVSHELRTPLNGVMGLAEMLQYGVYGAVTEKQESALNQIIERVGYLNQLVTDLLQHTKLDSGKFSLEIKEFDPEILLQRGRETFEKAAQSKGLSFKTELSADVPPLLVGDSLRLFQILSNLTDNAIKFTETGGIEIRILRPDAGHWAMQVSDTGIGIPEEQSQHIFDAFHQTNFSVTRSFSGVGLGLAIVKQLADALDGTISMHPNSKQGSIFLITFPLKSVQAAGLSEGNVTGNK
jgi:PAS domain S-box-containing protein